MTIATRQLKIEGYLITETSTATILVNGAEVYSGTLAVGSTGPMLPSDIVDLASFDYTGETTVEENVNISVTVDSGSAAFGLVMVDCADDNLTTEQNWENPKDKNPAITNDGRTSILINGEPPVWPVDGPREPGGTPDNPDWSGWTFELSAGDTIDFNYLCLPYTFHI